MGVELSQLNKIFKDYRVIFKLNNNQLELISEKKINLERDVQKLTEQNLETVFGLKFICSEFQLNGLRIDSLGFDEENKSFVIIEYKKDSSFSIVDQGYAYLALMLNNKADFILEYNEKMRNNLKRQDIDWSQSRVIFVANSFTTYQQNAINFKDLPIELWEVKAYDNGTILYNQLKSPDSSESIKTISKNKTVESVSKEIKKYTIQDHFRENWEETKTTFNILNEGILSFDTQVVQKITKLYIAYAIDKNNFCEIVAQASKLRIYIDIYKKNLKDPRNISKDCSNIGHWGTGSTEFNLKIGEDTNYALEIIHQAYKRFMEKG